MSIGPVWHPHGLARLSHARASRGKLPHRQTTSLCGVDRLVFQLSLKLVFCAIGVHTCKNNPNATAGNRTADPKRIPLPLNH
ncbi:hypothetical protein PVK06_033972 [Gossypium arboreum]|uniref:Uncharacterized protein n=1 Tax=Gossypium arboreum TaxID=29729 RepID=A0ABR0NDV9_GOSAR|nr:hypothetical protein PVK06_033972 [Gossypium arboreum]